MTTDQPQSGRELDKAIARRLGWEYIDDTTSARWGAWENLVGDILQRPDPFSTDDAAALALLQQLCKPVEEGGRGWSGYRLAYTDKMYWTEILPAQFIYKSKISLAHAASLAILAALEAETKTTNSP